MKIFHFHIVDPMGNEKTLISNLKEGSIQYIFYSGTSSSGMPNSLSNLQLKGGLPVDKKDENETKEEFKERVKSLINTQSVYRVINEVTTNITF